MAARLITTSAKMKFTIGIFFTLGFGALLFAFDGIRHAFILWNPDAAGAEATLTLAGEVYFLGAAAALVAEILAMVNAVRAKERLVKSEAFLLCSMLIGGYAAVLITHS